MMMTMIISLLLADKTHLQSYNVLYDIAPYSSRKKGEKIEIVYDHFGKHTHFIILFLSPTYQAKKMSIGRHKILLR